MAIYNGFNPTYPVTGLYVNNLVAFGRKPDVRTEFTVRATGFKEGAATLSDESGSVIFTGRRGWNLIVFTRNSDNTVTPSHTSYDLYGDVNAGSRMSTDIRAIPEGADICVFTYDEPSTNKNTITDALLMLGATRAKLNALPFRGSYILTGRKGMAAGQGKEYQVNTGGTQAQITFINGVMQ
ncbi:hypothetical protein EI827_10670 [Salmonella enterica subsp. enterica serovar Oranienburg]|nr:hypothetical protein [Salmonella enterica subsp. enterica serovar Oranienburg]ECA1472571.1 hypothetical protein [Salmonella enterica subsp. enterica serovar Oranienburg]ECA8999002.1 hypothetical protein [Salmonella enterica subsp. enterica serovar Oranienburg]ECA9345862.1 hypothetical protein [Salmonella enterica subsp. enterica serovar Oranienburg]ECD3080694.1 hypothetical protein [Salmonella enterica subsp. enterica serovar Oranienburg]